MSFDLPLTQEDINFLTGEKEATQEQNQNIQDSSITISTEIAKLLLIDVPFKKKTDPVHVDIYEFEEELRRLNGTSIIQPLQEKGFTISNTSGSPARLYINNERLIIRENGNEIANVPLFPVRGYSKSLPAGSNFDIWSRDRFGSSTSTKHVVTTFPIDIYHKKFAVRFDGSLDVEIDLSELISIEQEDEQLINNSTGYETTISLLNKPVIVGSDSIKMTYNPVSYTSILISETTGVETNVMIPNAPIALGSETLTMTSVEEANFFDLVNGTDYSIDYSTGIVTFLTVVQAGFELTVTYQGDSPVINLVRGIDYSIDYITGIVSFLHSLLPGYEVTANYKNQVEVAAAGIASSIQLLLQQANPSLENATCIFNEIIKTFTVISSHGGPTSSVEVISASEADLKSMLGFDSQYMIQGKFQNNLLNVEIDGETAEIKIADFRLCFEDPLRGYNNDDLGFDWSGDLSTPLGYVGRDKLGPLFCSGINNGKEVAKSIEAQLRIVGSGGFKDAMVHYFTADQTFVIYSGTMGTASSVHILPASDSDRDCRDLLGFSSAPFMLPREERGNEEYFETLQKLFNRLAIVPNTIVSDLSSPNRLSHSILYTQSNGVNIHSDFQDCDATTTKIYDDGSRGWPRLYPDGKITVDDTNNKIDFFEEVNVEKTATISHAVYENEAFLAEAIQEALNNAKGHSDTSYTCEYKAQLKRFIITSNLKPTGAIFSILWQTGRNALYSIGNYIGYSILSDKTGSGSYTSDREIVFRMQDFFYPFFPNQFDGSPKVPDLAVDEQSALYKEEEYLNEENSLSFFDTMSILTSYDNEVLIDSWEYLASLELAKVNQEYTAIRYHRGAYANHISDSDSEITKKTIAYEDIKPNRNNLIDNLVQHAKFLNLSLNSKTFVSGVDFTNEGSQTLSISVSGPYDKRIYNRPAPLVKYISNPRQVPGRFSPAGLWSTSAVFTPEQLTAFKITNPNPATRGYSYSESDIDGYSVRYPVDSVATILSTNSGNYDMSAGDTLKMKIDGGVEQTATFDATPGYTESRVAITDQFIVKAGANDKLDFSEGLSAAKVSNTIDQNYSLENGDQLGISVDLGPVQLATFSATQGYQEGTVLGNSKFGIKTSLNDRIDFEEIPGFEKSIAIPQGVYSGSNLALQIQTLLNSIGSSVYTVSYNSTSDKFLISSNLQYKIVAGVNDKIDFKEIDGNQLSITITAGTYTAAGLALEIQTQLNSIGKSVYSVSYSGVTKKFTITSDGSIKIVSGLNDKLDFSEQVGIELTATITSGSYSPAALATEIQNQLNAFGGDYTVTYNSGTKKFTITSNFSYLVQTGVNDKIDFSEQIGVELTATIPAGTYTATSLASAIQTSLNQVGSDYAVTFDSGTKKFTLTSNFSYNIQSGINDKLDYLEQDTVQLTATIPAGSYTGSNLASTIQSQLNSTGSTFSVSFDSGTKKFTISTNNLLEIVTGTNDRIDFNEQETIQLTATIPAGNYTPSDLASTIQSQLNSTGYDYTVSYNAGTKKFTIASNFAYQIGTSNNKINFREKQDVELTATLATGTYTGSSLASEIQTKLNTAGKSTYTTSHSSDKFILTSDGKIEIEFGTNDGIDFYEIETQGLYALIPSGSYTPSALATEIQNQMNDPSNIGSVYSVSYSSSKFTLSSDGSVNVVAGINDKLDFGEGSQKTASLTAGRYSATDLAAHIQARMRSAGTKTYNVSYSGNKFIISAPSSFDLLWLSGSNSGSSIGYSIGFDMGTDQSGSTSYTAPMKSCVFGLTWSASVNSIGSTIGFTSDNSNSMSYTAVNETGLFNILWSTGSNSSTSVGATIGFNTGSDDSGSLSYSADNKTGILNLLWNTGTNSARTIGKTIGFITTSDDTSSLSYTSDNRINIFSILWATGTNSSTSIGITIGFNTSSDDTGLTSYVSDVGMGYFSILWATGTNSSTSIGTLIGFNTISDDTGSLSYTSDLGLGIFSILWNSGTNSSISIGSTIGFNTGSDDVGSLAYTSDSSSGLFELLWATGTHTATTAGRILGFDVSLDDTSALSYVSDYTVMILSLLWATGTHTATSIGPTIGFNVVNDTGSSVYQSDVGVAFKVTSGYTDQLTITRNGISQSLTISASNYSTDTDLKNEIQNKIDLAFGSGQIIVSLSSNVIRFTSSTFGTSSTISTSSSNAFLEFISFSSPTTVNGSGSFVDISTATAAEVIAVLNASWSGVTATPDGNRIRVTHNSVGFHNFQISDGAGNPNTQLGFPLTSNIGYGKIAITIPAGAYTGSSLALQIQTLMNASGDSNYLVDYDTTSFDRFTFISDGLGGTGLFQLLLSSGDNVASSIGYTLGFNTSSDKTGNLIYSTDNQTRFTVITGINDEFTIKINIKTSANTIIIPQGFYTIASLVSEMAIQIANDPMFDSLDFSITYPGNKFRITSSKKGFISKVEVYEGTNDFLRTVALDGDAPVYGGLDVIDIDNVTVDEVCAVLNSEIIGISATNDGNKVRFTTTSVKGSLSTIEITGGTCRTIVGFDLGLVNGVDQDNKLKVNIDGDETKDPIEVITSSSMISGSSMASSIQTLLRVLSIGGYTSADCTFDETTIFQNFNKSLRIISGTYGSSSTVYVSNKTIKIISSVNDKFDFEEVAGVQLTAILSPGFYNATTLASELKTKMEDVGANTYSISYSTSTRKMTISSSGTYFKMLFGTGTNASQSVSDMLAFYAVDHSSSLSYTSNGFVKLRSCFEELGFDVQTTEPGHDLNSIKINISDVRMTSYIYWLDHGGGNRLDLDIDLTVAPANNISGLISSINSFPLYDTKHNYAYLLGRVSEKFRIDDGDSLVVSANNGASQTVIFSAVKAKSVSGSSPWTRIFSGSSDRLRLRVDSLSSEVGVSNESLMSGVAAGGEKNFTTNNAPIKAGSTSITLMRLLPLPMPVNLSEGSDYSINYGTGQIKLNSGLITGDFDVKIDYTYYTGTYELVLGTQLTPEAIAAKIQQEIRAIYHSNIETRSTFALATCSYVNGRYEIIMGNGGTSSKIHVYDGSINSAAPGLKLGLDYGGTETDGSGDVSNSNFVTVNEVVTKLNSSLTDITASGPDYIKLTSNVLGDTTRVYVSSCSLASKLGFDIGINNDSYPLVDLASVDSTTIKNVSNQEIQTPTIFTALRGWETQKGNVDITFYSIDNQRIEDRKTIVIDRLNFIPVRKPQIPIRVATIIASLTPSLYNLRKDKVRIRLNKKTGSYVKVGDKFGQQENNQSTIQTNNEYIATINSILP
jgi:hypothetical protein